MEAHEDIEEVKIFLTPLGVTNISMKERLSIEELQQQLDQLEDYTIAVLN